MVLILNAACIAARNLNLLYISLYIHIYVYIYLIDILHPIISPYTFFVIIVLCKLNQTRCTVDVYVPRVKCIRDVTLKNGHT